MPRARIEYATFRAGVNFLGYIPRNSLSHVDQDALQDCRGGYELLYCVRNTCQTPCVRNSVGVSTPKGGRLS